VPGRAESRVGSAAKEGVAVAALAELLPGVVLCGVIALAASFVARLHDGPPVLYALLFGMTMHGIGSERQAAPGIELCSRFVLRLGVALLGARIGAEQIVALGWPTALLVLAAVASTIAGGAWLARRLGLTLAQGLVSGGATAICGASAALAIAALLPRSREQERFTLLVVVGVSTLSTVAMLVYPLLTRQLGWTPPQAGLFLGASIHDVAQVMGAAQLLGPAAADTAVIVKLFRVSLLVVVVAGVAWAVCAQGLVVHAPGTRRPPLLPWFLLAFAGLVVLNSLHVLPPGAEPMLSSLSRACLLTAIAALGLKTAWRSLAEAGWRPLLLLLAETLWLAAIVAAGVLLLAR
jgi:uncharacterized integral membrane protein (TIGR00698 family)